MLCFFDDEPEVNEHRIAWLSQDWDSIKKLVNEFKPEPSNGLFKALNNINSGKDFSIEMPEDYSQFVINSMLCNHLDCLEHVYYANMFLSKLPDKVHYNYMLNLIPKGKRFSKSTKLDDPLHRKFYIELIRKFYKVNHNKAYSYYDLMMTKDTLESFMVRARPMVTEEFIKTITKNPKEIKEMKKL